MAPPPSGSRFRGRFDPAVFYGAEDVKTACAEAGYWRLRFWMDSEGLASQSATMQMTLFEFHGATQAMLDLTRPPFKTQRKTWIHSSEYTKTQKLAAQARQAGIEMIRSESVRNGPDGRCLTILTAAVFRAVAEPFRHQMTTWSLFIQPPNRVVWQWELNGERFQFDYA